MTISGIEREQQWNDDTTRSPDRKSTLPYHAYAVAPMMEVTDRHFRTMARLISRRATLYTEMVVDRTIIHNPVARDLELRIPDIPPVPDVSGSEGEVVQLSQSPLVLQLGGSVPEELEQAARYVAKYPYTEVNLNCGCPSPKVAGKGCFGASLMRTPEVVAEATRRIAAVLPETVPVTVKCRIGVDDDDSYESLHRFISIVSGSGGVKHFIIHARKAILKGLSPAQNRSIPPLKHEYVYQLLRDFPHLRFSINGGIRAVDDVARHLQQGMHGVMVGRGVMDRPWDALCDVDTVVYGESPEKQLSLTRRRVLKWYTDYAEHEIESTGCPLRPVLRPLLNLFYGEVHGKRFRRVIDESLRNKSLGIREVINSAVLVLPREVLDRPSPSALRLLADRQSPQVDSRFLFERDLKRHRVDSAEQAHDCVQSVKA